MKYKLLSILFMMNTIVGLMHGSTFEDEFRANGLVDISTISLDIKVELMYGRDDNFTGQIMYDGLDKAWLHPDAARAVAKAQDELSRLMPGFKLLIKDAARPMSVQRKMFDAVKGTSRANYVANPAKGGGLHNYGVAVDITIVDPDGHEIDMGTPVDHLGVEANIDREVILVKAGIISENARQNRILLRRIMKNAGFSTIRTEWWHFNFVNKVQARKQYKLLDF